MINFTNCLEIFNSYKGSEKKKTLIYDGKKYLVKFPDPVRSKHRSISYINNVFSEYVGSNIFRLIGYDVQNTILGIYNYNGKEKIVCACEDFTDEYNELYEFENLALSTNPDKKIETEISDILNVLEETEGIINVDDVKKMFWDMFIIDSLIGNTDRHNGNWGFLINKLTGKAVFSPVFDCGSCLNPMLEDEDLAKIDDAEMKNLAVNCHSCLRVDGKRINYFNFIMRMSNDECNNALIRVMNKIDMYQIDCFIDNIDCISLVRKEFYKRIIRYRYSILERIYVKLKPTNKIGR